MTLDPAKVTDMWLHGATMKDIADKYGVHQTTVSNLVRRQLRQEFGVAPFQHRMQWQKDLLLERRRRGSSLPKRIAMRLGIA